MPHQNHNQSLMGLTLGSSSDPSSPSLQLNGLLHQTTLLVAQESHQARQNLQGLQPIAIASNDVATTASTNSDTISNELDRRAENE